ncbi:unnamed protein product [Trichogramma brassicae]|uniref:Uncharacterized protein n=1 Tax=Trichogramma brassicae TaxID=86971 RepID=A0A6H5IXS9_9HYME|nr:unnamed protein product [Trichogramma brassicae]
MRRLGVQGLIFFQLGELRSCTMPSSIVVSPFFRAVCCVASASVKSDLVYANSKARERISELTPGRQPPPSARPSRDRRPSSSSTAVAQQQHNSSTAALQPLPAPASRSQLPTRCTRRCCDGNCFMSKFTRNLFHNTVFGRYTECTVFSQTLYNLRRHSSFFNNTEDCRGESKAAAGDTPRANCSFRQVRSQHASLKRKRKEIKQSSKKIKTKKLNYENGEANGSGGGVGDIDRRIGASRVCECRRGQQWTRRPREAIRTSLSPPSIRACLCLTALQTLPLSRARKSSSFTRAQRRVSAKLSLCDARSLGRCRSGSVSEVNSTVHETPTDSKMSDSQYATHSPRFELLTRDNYDTWRIQVEALLVKNDSWDYVSGASPAPSLGGDDAAARNTAEASHKAWVIKDRKAKSDLILSISPSELKEIKNCITSHDVWTKLEATYASKTPARKASLYRQLTQQKMAEDDSMVDHLKSFFDATDKLKSTGANLDDDLLAIMLLHSLPSQL